MIVNANNNRIICTLNDDKAQFTFPVAKPTPVGVKMEPNKKWWPIILMLVIVSFFPLNVLADINPQDLYSNFPGIYYSSLTETCLLLNTFISL